MNDTYLSVKLEYEENLAIGDFINRLQGLEKSYRDFGGNNTHLAIKEINKGSIKIIFTVLEAARLLIQEVALQSIIEYGKYLVRSINYAKMFPKELGKKIAKGDIEAKKTGETFSDVLGAGKDFTINGNGNTVHIFKVTVVQKGEVIEQTELTTKEGNAILQHHIAPAVQTLQEFNHYDFYGSQRLTFQSITVLKNVKSGFKGLISTLHDKSIKVTFISDEVRESFGFVEDEAIFLNKVYLVDVNVHYNKDKSISRYEIVENMGEDT